MALELYSPLKDLLLTLGILACALTAGRGLLWLLRVRTAAGTEGLVFNAALGLALMAYLTMGLGSLGLLRPLPVWGAIGLAVAGGLPLVPAVWGDLRQTAASLRLLAGSSRLASVSLALLAAMAGLNLLGSLAPVTYSDTLNHYMALSKFFVVQGGLAFEPYKWWAMPASVEMLYADAMLLHPGAVGAPIHFLFGLLTLLAVMGLCRRYVSPLAAVAAGVAFYTIPTITQESTIAKNDLALALFSLLGFWATLRYLETRSHAWLLAGAVMIGLALGTKLYGLLVAGAIGLSLLVGLWRVRRSTYRSILLPALGFGLVAALVASPWYIRSFLATGDPIWPFGYGVFHGQFWDAYNHQKFLNYELGLGRGPLALLAGPWNFTTNLEAFQGERVPAITPIFLALLPGLALAWSSLNSDQRWLAISALVFALAYYAVWFQLYQQPTYIFVLTPFLAVALAPVLHALLKSDRLARWSTLTAMGICLSFGLGVNLGYNAQFLPAVLGFQTPHSYAAAKVSYYEDIQFANSLPSDSKVLVFPTTDYYFDVDHINGLPGFQGRVDYPALQTASALLERWRQLGVTHVFRDREYYENGADHVEWATGEDRLREQVRALEQEGQLVPVYRNSSAKIVDSRTFGRIRLGEVVIYEVRYESAGRIAADG